MLQLYPLFMEWLAVECDLRSSYSEQADSQQLVVKSANPALGGECISNEVASFTEDNNGAPTIKAPTWFSNVQFWHVGWFIFLSKLMYSELLCILQSLV